MIGGKKLSKIFKFNNENVFVHYHYKINAQILLVKVSLSNMQQIMENLCPSSSRIYAWKKNCLQYCYNLKRAQSGPIKSVWTRPGDKDKRDLEPSAARDDATLTRGGRQKGSSPLASYSSGSTSPDLLDEHIWRL